MGCRKCGGLHVAHLNARHITPLCTQRAQDRRFALLALLVVNTSRI
jgi:hypothetical protein